ncbi:hypothetical protein DFH08DRAFT_1024151 [Mycena albidolilacea]|uniref:Uncharacterized protein n=1 Tax=Mycena albidolilacea TaxID=1033008 RepID=A0AAD7ALE0_9AGAR|nr:hypothetical protein DFH08DRAFT_1024151 [Mycena albidolilacea]
MIESGTPQNQGGEFIDGVPVVVLHDAADDVHVFLRAIFDSSYFMPPPEPVYFAGVLAILRLSHKYDVGYLHRRALTHLSTEFYHPSVEEYIGSLSKIDHLQYPPSDGPTDAAKISRVFALVNAAHEIGALWLLPGHTTTPAPVNSRISCRRWMKGQTHTTFLHEPIKDCMEPTRCPVLRRSLRSWIFKSKLPFRLLISGQTYGGSPGGRSTLMAEAKFCPPCYEAGILNLKVALEDRWNRLPTYFGLPGWPELEAMREVAMRRGNS